MNSANAPAGRFYRRDDQVQVWWHGAWRPAVVLTPGGKAVIVRYRTGGDAGTAVDTVTLDKLRPPSDLDVEAATEGRALPYACAACRADAETKTGASTW